MLQLLGQTLRQLLAEKLGLKVCQAACPVFCLSDCTVMLSPSFTVSRRMWDTFPCCLSPQNFRRALQIQHNSLSALLTAPPSFLSLPYPSLPFSLYTLRIIIYAAGVATLMWLQVCLCVFFCSTFHFSATWKMWTIHHFLCGISNLNNLITSWPTICGVN